MIRYYNILDEDGDKTLAMFDWVGCSCCSDAKLYIYEDGEDNYSSSMDIPNALIGYIVGLLEGSSTSKEIVR